jgi:thiol-disulfide isomerase/thioredoxin
MALSGACLAAPAADLPPHLDTAGQAAYRQYLGAETHRAFAIAPGGRWGWSAGAATPDQAGEQALAYCQERNEQRCVLYGVDAERAFDARAWPGLWGPYADAAQAARAARGVRRGQRFPDLVLHDPRGRRVTLADLRGEVVVLHFWGSWCPACRKELPDMQAAAGTLAGAARFVLVQVREPASAARAWLKRRDIRLDTYDGGARSAGDAHLRLADDVNLPDRDVAKAFPSTYVLDRHGLVLFSHTGPLHAWSEYVPFLRHAARGGK